MLICYHIITKENINWPFTAQQIFVVHCGDKEGQYFHSLPRYTADGKFTSHTRLHQY